VVAVVDEPLAGVAQEVAAPAVVALAAARAPVVAQALEAGVEGAWAASAVA
jgi:hypothetical protein